MKLHHQLMRHVLLILGSVTISDYSLALYPISILLRGKTVACHIVIVRWMTMEPPISTQKWEKSMLGVLLKRRPQGMIGVGLQGYFVT